MARGYSLRRSENAGNVWCEVGHAVGVGTYNYNTKGQCLDFLLEFQVAVKGDKYFTDAVSAAEELAVFDACPAEAMHRYGFMPYEQFCEVGWEVLVKQYPHRP